MRFGDGNSSFFLQLAITLANDELSYAGVRKHAAVKKSPVTTSKKPKKQIQTESSIELAPLLVATTPHYKSS